MVLFERVLYIATNIFYTIIFAYFLIMPFRTKLRFEKKQTLVIAAVYTLLSLTLFCTGFDDLNLTPIFHTVPLFIWLALTVFGCFLCVKTTPAELLFSLFIILNVQANALVFSRAVRLLILKPYFAGWEFPGSWLFSSTVILLVFFVPMLWYLLGHLLKKVVEFQIEFRYWRYLWILPMLFYISLYVSDFGGVGENGAYQWQDLLTLILSNATSFAAYTVCLKMLIKVHESMMASQRAYAMERQLQLQKSEYAKLTQRISDTARQRHDLRHHLTALGGFMQDKNYPKAEEFLAQYLAENDGKGGEAVCKNVTADHLLRHFIVQAREAGTRVSCEAVLPEELPISDPDICILLGNLMENAVDACRRQTDGERFLKIHAQANAERLLLSIENSFDGTLNYRDGIYLSTKHAGEGIGLSSVRGVVAASGGEFQITAAEGVFRARIFIHFKEEEKLCK